MGGLLRTLILLGAVQGFIVSALLAASARRGRILAMRHGGADARQDTTDARQDTTDARQDTTDARQATAGARQAAADTRQDEAGATSKRLLARILLLLAMACLNLWLIEMPGYLGSITGNLINALVPLVVVTPVGPLVWLYVRSCLEPEFRFTRRYRRHFYIVVVDLFPYAASLIYVLLIIFGVILGGKDYGFGSFLDNYNQYGDIPRWLSLAVYLGVSWRYLRRAGTTQSPESMAWPRNLLRVFTGFAILWLIHLIPYELPRYGDALIDRFGWYPLYLPIVLLIYWLGVKGYFISYRPARTLEDGDNRAAGRAALDPGVVASAIQSLKKAMELDRLWLDPALNLGALAQHCGLAPKTVSAVLNQHLEKTFNEYVNDYRVATFKHRILLPESRELTIAGLAYECGFNSLPTFQRAFKAITGLTPKEYMQKSALTLHSNCDKK